MENRHIRKFDAASNKKCFFPNGHLRKRERVLIGMLMEQKNESRVINECPKLVKMLHHDIFDDEWKKNYVLNEMEKLLDECKKN